MKNNYKETKKPGDYLISTFGGLRPLTLLRKMKESVQIYFNLEVIVKLNYFHQIMKCTERCIITINPFS